MNTFYGELARWWPLISPVEDYAPEGAEILTLLQSRRPNARTLLELGSGGGHVAHYLRGSYTCTLTDLNPAMLDLSRQLNPDCAHHVGDMRDLDLGRRFDLVLAHDAIDYMATEADLRAAIATAHRHLEAGGLVLLIPDAVEETYTPGTDVSGVDAEDGRGVRLFEWSQPPGGDGTAVVHYTFLLRGADGGVQSVYERHVTGLFTSATWTRLLEEAGFGVEVVVERTAEDRPGRLMYLGHKSVSP